MAKGQKQKKTAVSSPLAPAKKINKFQKKKAKDAAARTPYASDANEVGDAAAGATGRLAGFMFGCCSSMTRQCFEYGVFGLPRKHLELVEKIRKGTMLFLYDYELQLLYGVYKAISNGGLNLEAAAFNGTLPAQVKFKMVYDCVPLPGDSVNHVILENCITGELNPEVNSEQVKKLMSLFLWPPPPRMFGERHRLAPDDRYRSGLYRSVIPPPQDAYRQPVAAPFNQLDSQANNPENPFLPEKSSEGLLKRVEGIMDRVDGTMGRIMDRVEGTMGRIMDRVEGLCNLIQREQPPAPPSRDYGSLKATEGERASRAGHPPSAAE